MLESILANQTQLSIINLLICSSVSIILGLAISITHMLTTKYSKNFLITLALLPILVQAIILMVNGNLGTSIAIFGAFGLIRFRSLPGTSKEILSIFFAMAIGLATGMGQLLFATIITIIVGLTQIILSKVKFLDPNPNTKILKINISDDLDYTEVFDDIFLKYLKNYTLDKVKTVNLGSLFEITYTITLKKDINEKEFLDELRLRNSNLKIILTHPLEENEF